MDLDKVEKLKDLHRVCNALHHRLGFEIMEINGFMLGMVTKSLENRMGSERGREFVETIMDKIWRQPGKSFHLFGYTLTICKTKK